MHSYRRKRLIPWAVTLTLAGGVLFAFSARDAWAGETTGDETSTKGVVLAIDGDDVIIDLGDKRGALGGDVVELWRPLKLKHPVTGKMVLDRFEIGALKVWQVRDALSLAKGEGKLLRPVEVGDVVVLARAEAPAAGATRPVAVTPAGRLGKPGKNDGAPPGPSASSGAGAQGAVVVAGDPEAQSLGSLFDSLRASDVETRIQAYDAFVASHPGGRFTQVLREESEHLGALRADAKESRAARARSEVASVPPRAIAFQRPVAVLAGAPLTLGVEVDGTLVGGVVQVRGSDETAFTPLPMTQTGDQYWSVTIPAARIRAPGISYFIEAVRPNGAAEAIVGTASAPTTTGVDEPPRARAPAHHASTFSLWSDYASYNRLRGNDYAWQTEGYFGIRLGDLGLRAVRSGFGVYKGMGGGLAELDDRGLAPRSVGLTYGYIEGEWGFTDFWGVVGRVVVGLGENGVTSGGQAFVRIGSDTKTNLLVGGEVLGGVGFRGITQIQLEIFPRVPIILRSEVTNQPAGTAPDGDRLVVLRAAGQAIEQGELGVRAIAQVGYRITPNLAVSVRGSYQGRTINHAGPGAGAGVTYSW